MSRFTTAPVGFNGRYKPMENPEAEVVLAGAWPAVVHAPGLSEFFACVIVSGEDGGREFYVGRDAFSSSEEALAVARARAREREAAGGD